MRGQVPPTYDQGECGTSSQSRCRQPGPELCPLGYGAGRLTLAIAISPSVRSSLGPRCMGSKHQTAAPPLPTLVILRPFTLPSSLNSARFSLPSLVRVSYESSQEAWTISLGGSTNPNTPPNILVWRTGLRHPHHHLVRASSAVLGFSGTSPPVPHFFFFPPLPPHPCPASVRLVAWLLSTARTHARTARRQLKGTS